MSTSVGLNMLFSPLQFGPVLTFLCISFCGLFHLGHSNSALMSSTLTTFQESSCDGEEMKVRCPKGSLVSIQFAQYGRQVPSSQMCPYTTNVNGSITPLKKFTGRVTLWEDTNCLATTSLQVILNNCQNRQHCHLVASTNTFEQDPCPGTGKYLEVAYKCRPNEFKSETVCEDEQLELWCRKSTRIAIFSVLYGMTPGGNSQCPDPQSTNTTNCQSRTAYQEVMKRCHGSKKCTITADDSVFENPCSEEVKKYLNIVYTCVPRKVLISIRHKGDHHKKKPATDASTTTQKTGDILDVPDKVLLQTTKAPSPPSEEFPRDAAQQPGVGESRIKTEVDVTQPDKQGPDKKGKVESEPSTACPNTTVAVGSSHGDPASTGLLLDWLNAFNFMKKNREKAVLYLVLGIAAGLICLLILVIIRLSIVNRRRSRAKLNISEPIPEDPHPIPLPPPSPLEPPTTSLERSESIDRMDVVRFSPRPRDYATCTLRSDIGNRSMTNYYG